MHTSASAAHGWIFQFGLDSVALVCFGLLLLQMLYFTVIFLGNSNDTEVNLQ